MAHTTSVLKRIAAAAKTNAVMIRRAAIDTYWKSIHEAAKNNNGKLPYGYMLKFVKENRKISPWITRDIINSAYSRFKKRLLDGPHSDKPEEIEVTDRCMSVHTSLSDLSGSQTSSSRQRSKGGRPVGRSFLNKRKREMKIVAMKNDIVKAFKEKIDEAKKIRRKVKNGILQSIIKKHKERNELQNVDIPLATIRQRIVRNKLVINSHQHGGHQSPLAFIEYLVVNILCQMSHFENVSHHRELFVSSIH